MDAPPADPRPVAELIRVVLEESDEDQAWNAVVALHFRGSKEVLEAARILCQRDQSLRSRRAGADILGQLGVPQRSFPTECLEILLQAWSQAQEEDVLHAIAVAMGHLKDARAIAPLACLASHPSAKVRHGVIFGLLSHEEDLAVRTLIELSRDSDELVRDWATFGLGTQLDMDTPQIRDALAARLTDPDAATRMEACKGLLKRKDDRLVPTLQRELCAPTTEDALVEALIMASQQGDPRLYQAVLGLRGREQHAALIEDALACSLGGT